MKNNKKPERILQITGNMNLGGAETMIMNIYREINREKVQFDFLFYSEEEADYENEILNLGGNIIRIPSFKNSGFLEYFKNLKKINNEYGPYSAIHSHTLFNSGISLLCSKIIGIPIRICHAHSTSNSNDDIKHKIYENFMRLMINISATQKLACGVEAGNYLYGKKFERIGKVIPNSINKDFLLVNKEKLIQCKEKLINNENNTIIIGHVGSFREVKNHKFMIDIAEEMKKRNILFKMVFVGDGPLFKEIAEIISIKGLESEIILLGLRRDINILMKTFDVLLMPSLFEGLPVTLIESQASKIMAVISDNISKEVDLGLGLIKRLSLNDGRSIWIESLLEGIKIKDSVSQNILTERLYELGYLTENNIKTLINIYGIEDY